MKNIKKGFTLIELIVAMIISTTLTYAVSDFVSNFLNQANELTRMEQEYKEVSLGLTSLQKIISDKGRYFSFNEEINSGGICEGKKNVSKSCNIKFYFYTNDGQGGEIKNKVVFDDCVGALGRDGRILYYSDGINIIPLTRCIESSEDFGEVNHSIEFINNDIKEKIFRYKIGTEYGTYITTLFTKD